MKITRALLILIGIGFGLWGLWLMRDFTGQQLTSEGIWFAGGVVLHDAVLAPIVVVIGFGASRILPGHFRSRDGDGVPDLGHADDRVPADPQRRRAARPAITRSWASRTC